MKKILLILVILTTQCQLDSHQDYSVEMVDYVDSMGTVLTGSSNHGFSLRHDSILQISEDKTYLLEDISTGVVKDRTYRFQNDHNIELELRRLNYTDLEVVIFKENSYKSRASMTLDVLQYDKVIELDSTNIKANSFDLDLNGCKGTLLLTKPSTDEEDSRIVTLRFDKDCSDLDKINGRYKEK